MLVRQLGSLRGAHPCLLCELRLEICELRLEIVDARLQSLGLELHRGDTLASLGEHRL